MKISTRQLKRIIKEERDLLVEKKKWQAMLLKEDSGGIASALFSGIKELGSKAPEMMVQWLKANPDMLEAVLDDMIDDPKIKDIIRKFLPQGGDESEGGAEEEGGEEDAEEMDLELEDEDEKKVVESLRRRLRARQRRSR